MSQNTKEPTKYRSESTLASVSVPPAIYYDVDDEEIEEAYVNVDHYDGSIALGFQVKMYDGQNTRFGARMEMSNHELLSLIDRLLTEVARNLKEGEEL